MSRAPWHVLAERTRVVVCTEGQLHSAPTMVALHIDASVADVIANDFKEKKAAAKEVKAAPTEQGR